MNVEAVLQKFAQEYEAETVIILRYSTDNTLQWVAEWSQTSVSSTQHARIHQAVADKLCEVSELNIKLFYQGPWCIVFRGNIKVPTVGEMELRLQAIEVWLELLIDLDSAKKEQLETPETFMEAASEIVASIHRTDVLDLMLHTCIENIPNADTGWLFLYDTDLERLVVKAAVGFRNESYVKTRLRSGEGMSGHVFQTGTPTRVNGVKNVKRIMSTMSMENSQYYLDAAIYGDYPRALMAAPLSNPQGRIGVLTMDNFTIDTTFSETDLSMLQAFADLASVVIEHSQSFRKVHHENVELSLSYKKINNEKGKLLTAIQSHKQLLSIVARGGNTPEILQGIHQVVNSPMAVYDSLLVPMASAPQNLLKRLPDSFLRLPQIKRLKDSHSEDKLVLIETIDGVIYVSSIVGMNRVIGYLCCWVPKSASIEYVFRSVLSYGARVIGLEWTKQDALRESRQLAIGRIAEEMLNGNIDASLLEQANFLGFAENSWYVSCILRERTARSDESYQLSTALKVIGGVLDRINAFHVEVPVREGTSIIIINLPQEKRREQLDFIHGLMSTSRKLDSMQLTIGRPYQGIGQISKSYKEAQSCLELYDGYQVEESALYFGELGVLRFFMLSEREEMSHYVTDVLQPLIDIDRQSGTATLMNTLLAYIKYDRSLKRAAATLHVHYNTLYYRIRRIEGILGYSFQKSDDWLNVKLACQIYKFLFKL